MVNKYEKKRMHIYLRIVEPTPLNSKWSLNARYQANKYDERDPSEPFSEQFLKI